MDDKIKRESRQYVEKLFKKYDNMNSGAVTKADMHRILTTLLNSQPFDEMELEEMMGNYVKESKYTVHNKETNKFEMKYRQDTLDFPSVLAIAVKFLVKSEKRNQFSGTNLVRIGHFEPVKIEKNVDMQQKRKIF